jgi:hypothetical protein
VAPIEELCGLFCRAVYSMEGGGLPRKVDVTLNICEDHLRAWRAAIEARRGLLQQKQGDP